MIYRGLAADDHILGIPGGEEIAAAGAVPILAIEDRDPALRRGDIALVARRLGKGEGGPGHIGVVVEGRGMARAAEAPAMAQPARHRHLLAHEVEGRARRLDPGLLAEKRAGAGQGCDHQPVPVRQHLVVETRADAAVAPGEELGAGAGERRLGRVIHQQRPGAAIEDRMLFPIALGADVVMLLEQRRVVAEDFVDLRFVPDVELALDALAVGVERAGEGAPAGDGLRGGQHLAQQPGDDLADALLIERLAAFLPDQGQQIEQRGIVVEHLLEMRHQPFGIGGVAGEAAAQMIVDAALAHAPQRDIDRLAIAGIAAALPGAPEQLEDRHLGKFRRPADAAMDEIDLLQQALGNAVEDLRPDARARLGQSELAQRLLQRGDVLGHLLGIAVIGVGDGAQHLGEARPSPALLRREIGAAPEGMAVGGQEHGERPAALLAEQGESRLIDGIEVGALLAVDLDVDVEVVHERGRRLALEALMGHDMAPVAGGIADGEQDRLLLGLGLGQRLGSPGLPMHGIVLVLQQIRARLLAQPVAGGRGFRGWVLGHGWKVAILSPHTSWRGKRT